MDSLRQKRKKTKGASGVGDAKFMLMDQSIKRRVMYLYDRAVRKFRDNIALWKEYMEYLVRNKNFNKLNRVVAKGVQLHPTVLDFWLVGVYTELDMKGNLFSGRKLMLQAVRNNPESPQFYVEYFRFEVKFYEKIKTRIMILNGETDKKIEFIEDEEEKLEEEPKPEEGRFSDSTKLVEIVFENITELYGKNLSIIKQCRAIAKESLLLPLKVKDQVQAFYKTLKGSEAG